MFLWFGSKKDVKKKSGGRRRSAHCPECMVVTQFVECEAKESLHVFTVEVLSDVATVFRCSECGELFELEAEHLEAPTAPEQSPLLMARDLARQRKRREASAEKELAALKRKMKP